MDSTLKNYGTHQHLTVRNEDGKIIVCLYILPDNTVHGDSWVKLAGWNI